MGYKDVGAVYVNTTSKGDKYWSVKFNGKIYNIFKVKKGQRTDLPDYTISTKEENEPMPDYPKRQEPPQPSPLDSEIPF